jgi:molybdopterin-guanine dinucleotide biosynthesis protein A
MGGVDKGLQTFNGMPLALRTLTRLQMGGGVGHIMINANRNLAAYESFGASVWPDGLADYAGPLAGFLTGLEHCETPFLVTVPCDTPLLPLDLVPRLAAALEAENADIAMAAAPEPGKDGQVRLRPQPVFCLLRVGLLESWCRLICPMTTRARSSTPTHWRTCTNWKIAPHEIHGKHSRRTGSL